MLRANVLSPDKLRVATEKQRFICNESDSCEFGSCGYRDAVTRLLHSLQDQPEEVTGSMSSPSRLLLHVFSFPASPSLLILPLAPAGAVQAALAASAPVEGTKNDTGMLFFQLSLTLMTSASCTVSRGVVDAPVLGGEV